jgi:Kef-type K+ transport system membrane component KefB
MAAKKLTMELFLVLLILLCTSRLFGELAGRLNQPPLIGELLAGIALGIVASRLDFPLFRELAHDPSFLTLTDLGIFFLMLLGGAELRARELADVSGRSLLIALSGMAVPLACGTALGWVTLPTSQYKLAQCLFLGTALSITAVPASIRVLIDLGKLHTRAGQTIVSAAIIDDILSLVVLAVLTGILETGGLPTFANLAWLGLEIATFFALTLGLGRVLVPRMRGIVSHFHSNEFAFSSLLIGGFAFAVLAELLGLHFIVGAFAAGLFFERRFAGRRQYEQVKSKLNALAMGFMAPIFFASIGLNLDLTALTSTPLFVAMLVAVAFVTKIFGAGLAAWKLGSTVNDAVAIGVGMSSRGAVELIIANIALRAGLFEHPVPAPPIVAGLFSAVVIMAVVTTMVTPMALKFAFRRQPLIPRTP